MSERLRGDLQSEKIVAANLRLLCEEAAHQAERGQAMAAEAARMLAEPFADSTDRLVRLEKAASLLFRVEDMPSLTAAERVAFIDELLAVFAERGKAILPTELLPVQRDIPERISYFRTVYTDEAYDGFSASMRAPTVQYADAFFLSCEDVKNGEAGYCILPCKNSDGPLPGMMALADDYDLFRVGTYRAFHADGENATHFGLFSMAMPALPSGDALVLRFSAVADDASELAIHFTALSRMGLTLLHTEAGAPDEGGALPFTIAGEVQRGTLTAALMYLKIFAKQLLLRGLYEEIG